MAQVSLGRAGVPSGVWAGWGYLGVGDKVIGIRGGPFGIMKNCLVGQVDGAI